MVLGTIAIGLLVPILVLCGSGTVGPAGTILLVTAALGTVAAATLAINFRVKSVT